MIQYTTGVSSAAKHNSSAYTVFSQDDSKIFQSWRFPRRASPYRVQSGLRGSEKSHFLGESLELRFSSCRKTFQSTELFLRGKDVVRKRSVLVRAIERRQSSIDKWLLEESGGANGPTRWEKVKLRFSPDEEWKPSKAGIKRKEAEDGANSSDRRLQTEGSSGEYAEHVRPHERILADAKRRAIEVKDYVKSLDKEKVQNLISTTEQSLSRVPWPPYTGKLVAALGSILLFGIVLDALTWRLGRMVALMKKLKNGEDDSYGGDSFRGRAPSALSVLLDKDLRRKESVEWVNMVIGKLWNLYRRALESLLLEMLQPIIDDIEKPSYVQKVEVKSFFLGDDPLTVRTVERRTSRRVDDLQYHIGIRYTGGARLLLSITLKWGVIPLSIPVGVRGLDVDAEMWVKLRMVPTEPWIGQATWAFVTLPKIKLVLAPFGLLNLMSIPLVSMYLAKLLTEDLPLLFVRPNKNKIDFMKDRAVSPMSDDFNAAGLIDKSSSFSGELAVTLVEASKLSYIPYLKTDPYAIFILGEQVRRSKRNSQTSIIGPPGAPVWNQDFKLLVTDPKKQHLSVTLHDTLGFTSYPVGSGDLNLTSLQDTVPVDRKITLKTGWGPLPKRFAGEVVLRLTFKAYIDEDGDDEIGGELTPKGVGEVPGAIEQAQEVAKIFKDEAVKVAEFFQEKDLAKEMLTSLSTITSAKDVESALPVLGLQPLDEKKSKVMKAPDSETSVEPSPQNGSVKVSNTAATDFERNESKSVGNGGPEGDLGKGQFEVLNEDDQQSGNSGADGRKDKSGQVILWLFVVAGLAWVVAADLNFSNLFNP